MSSDGFCACLCTLRTRFRSLHAGAETEWSCFVFWKRNSMKKHPRILGSNPHTIAARAANNLRQIRMTCGLDSRSRAGFWKNDRAAIFAVRTIKHNLLQPFSLVRIVKTVSSISGNPHFSSALNFFPDAWHSLIAATWTTTTGAVWRFPFLSTKQHAESAPRVSSDVNVLVTLATSNINQSAALCARGCWRKGGD
jgi:hypothetical protein